MNYQIWNPCIKWKISPNQVYYLSCCQDKIQPSDELINPLAERIIAEKNGFITTENKLTGKGILALNEFNTHLQKSQKKVVDAVLGPDYVSKIKEYREIFPSKRLPSGQLARQNTEDIKKAFIWFFKNYPDYDWDLVLDATEYYVAVFEKKNYQFMATSKYFIKKDDKNKDTNSVLADYCQIILDNPDILKNL